MNTAAWLNHMLASVPLLLVLGRLCPNSKCLHSICVHAKAKTRNQQTSNGRKKYKELRKGRKANKLDRHGKHSRKGKKARKLTNKQESKQKVVSMRDKCRFGSNVCSFIVLKYG